MNRLLPFSLGTLIVLLTTPMLAYAVEMVEGEWELEVKHAVSGLPIDNPPLHYRQCLTKNDPIPTAYLEANSCNILEKQERRRTVTWRINCFTKNGPIINEGKMTYRSLKISGRSKTQLGDVAGLPTTVQYRITGRRIGDCQ